ncbi:MAG: T6SS effector amidase Tae4 family protein [Polyangiaceae bacterium]
MHRLPSFESLWTHYPNGAPETVKALIGGNINMAWVTNTCVIRVCYALNRCGITIHDGEGMHTARGGDGYRYGYRVSEFKTYMERKFGPPQKYSGQRGIIMFQVSSWSDATGHFDLYDGNTCRHECYFELSSGTYVWPC